MSHSKRIFAVHPRQILLTFTRFPSNSKVPSCSTNTHFRKFFACQVPRSIPPSQSFRLGPSELVGGGEHREGSKWLARSRDSAEAIRPVHASSHFTATVSSWKRRLAGVGTFLATRFTIRPVHEGESRTSWEQHKLRFHATSNAGTSATPAVAATRISAVAGSSLRASC